MGDNMTCLFDVIYSFDGRVQVGEYSVSAIRNKLCAPISKKITAYGVEKFDFIAPIPQTGNLYAQTIADAVSLPCNHIITKPKDQRTTQLNYEERIALNAKIFEIDASYVAGKNILLIDETIVSGQTYWLLRRQLLKSGANYVSCAIVAPRVRWRCPFSHKVHERVSVNFERNLRSRIKHDILEPDMQDFEEIVSANFICMLCHQ